MAGILRSTTTITNANVSGWLELPLPGTPEQEAAFQKHEMAVGALQAKIKSAKEAGAKLASIKRGPRAKPGALAANDLPGLVVDDSQAKRVGEWKLSQFSGTYIGDGYLHDLNEGKGAKTLTFLPELPRAGKYEVRFAYSADKSRAVNVPVTVFSADGERTISVNEQET